MHLEGKDAPIYCSDPGKGRTLEFYRCSEMNVPAFGHPEDLPGIFDGNVDTCLGDEGEGSVVDEKVGVGVEVGGYMPRLVAYAKTATAHGYLRGDCEVGFA